VKGPHASLAVRLSQRDPDKKWLLGERLPYVLLTGNALVGISQTIVRCNTAGTRWSGTTTDVAVASGSAFFQSCAIHSSACRRMLHTLLHCELGSLHHLGLLDRQSK
jgi:hypothetical protein